MRSSGYINKHMYNKWKDTCTAACYQSTPISIPLVLNPKIPILNANIEHIEISWIMIHITQLNCLFKGARWNPKQNYRSNLECLEISAIWYPTQLDPESSSDNQKNYKASQVFGMNLTTLEQIHIDRPIKQNQCAHSNTTTIEQTACYESNYEYIRLCT